VHNGAAEEFDYREATALFFFSPFGASTLDAVLHKMDHDSPHRRVRLAFVNCNEDQDKVFAKHSWLELYGYWDAERGGGHSVSFYRRTGVMVRKDDRIKPSAEDQVFGYEGELGHVTPDMIRYPTYLI
jgi:hypothetical protein